MHAVLSPSKAKQWLNCPPSIRLSEHIAGKQTGASIQGTTAHALAELMISNKIKALPQKEYKQKYTAIYDQQYPDNLGSEYVGRIVNGEMLELCDQYATFVLEQYNASLALDPKARIYLEVKADLSEYVKEGFGFLDVIIVAATFLHVIDLKYGKGVMVGAEDNDQLKMYGLAGLSAFKFIHDIEQVIMTIYQPRMDNIFTTEATADEILTWGETIVQPSADLAYEGKGETKAGDHCRWCNIKNDCQTRMNYLMEIVEDAPAHAQALTDAQISTLLSRAKEFTGWLDDVQEYALEQALQGRKFPGYKIVEGRSNRMYVDVDIIAMKLEHELKLHEHQIWQTPKLIGITEMEKQIGKKMFQELLSPYISKPRGKPTLVSQDDKRDEYNSADIDFADEL